MRNPALVSGAKGRRFKSSQARHSSFLALWKIRSKGFLYIGWTFAASTLIFMSSRIAPFEKDCLRSSKRSASFTAESRRP
jgi:hypothetical protein